MLGQKVKVTVSQSAKTYFRRVAGVGLQLYTLSNDRSLFFKIFCHGNKTVLEHRRNLRGHEEYRYPHFSGRKGEEFTVICCQQRRSTEIKLQ